MERDLGLTGFQVGNILGAFQAGYVLMVIITGWLADRIGARRVVLAGTLGVAACSTAFAFLASDFSSGFAIGVYSGLQRLAGWHSLDIVSLPPGSGFDNVRPRGST